MSKEGKQASVYLRPDLNERLGIIKAQTGRGKSWQVNDALDLVLDKGWARIPILSQVAAGAGKLALENPEETVLVPLWLVRGATFALEVDGDSMEPGIVKGDKVFVRAQPRAENNQIVIAVLDQPGGREGVVKRLRREGPGSSELRSDNEGYEPVRDFEIVGIVVGLLRSFA